MKWSCKGPNVRAKEGGRDGREGGREGLPIEKPRMEPTNPCTIFRSGKSFTSSGVRNDASSGLKLFMLYTISWAMREQKTPKPM